MEKVSGSKWFGSRSRPLAFNLLLTLVILLNCDMSGSTSEQRVLKRVPRQLGLGGFGGFGSSLLANLQPPQQHQQHHQYNTRQPNQGNNFFNTMMRMNFDMTEVVAMYRNVTATALTPGCLGHCRTPMALWVVQSFYPCYNLKKADCPKGQVCCVDDPAQRIASPNSIHDTRIKIKPYQQSLASTMRDRNQGHHNLNLTPPPTSSEDSAALPSLSSAQKAPPSSGPTPAGATQSTTLFDEEYVKNNFIQDEIPE